MKITEQSKDSFTLRPVLIPDELREFLAVVHILAEGLENGTYKLSKEGCFYWDEITWSEVGVFRTRMIGYPDESLAEFEFKYAPHFSGGLTEWEFDLSREELARVAGGTVEHLALYGCANPGCGYMSSRKQERCPRCHLESGVEISASRSQRVLGICPYCNKPLRTLYAQQCRHCLMDWHDPNHPTKLDAKS